jgi:glucokinase
MHWLGVDLGGTKILTGLFDADLKLVARHKQATGSNDGGEAIVGRIVTSVDATLEQAKIDREQVGGICLAVPGQVVPKSAIVTYAPNLDWRDFDLSKHFPAEWKWPVLVENDVRMGTYGEWSMGAAKGAQHVLGVFAGTGVGGGFILNGELFHGFNGHAGEIGHIVVNWKKGYDLESIAGRRSMMARAKAILSDAPKRVRKEWKGIDPTSFKSSQIAEYYERDEPVIVQMIDEAARVIAAGVGSVINLISPEVIVIGGGVTQAIGQQFTDRIWEIAQRYALPKAADNVRCVTSILGDDAGITGAAAYAKRRFGTAEEK